MKKILFITTREIYPINDGRKVVLYNYCKGLVKQHNCEVRLFTLINEDEMEGETPDFISKIYYSDLPTKRERFKNIIFNSLILKQWPLQVSLYYGKGIKRRLDKILQEYNPDIVICDMARTAEYFKDLSQNKYNKILDMDDLISKRYIRQINNSNLGSNAIGAYSKYIPKTINKLLDNGKIMSYILQKEAKLLSKYERQISKYYNHIIFVSPIEALEYNNMINSKKGIDITIGVDYEYFAESECINTKPNSLVFLGNMFVAHNKDAINNFLHNVFPLILERCPECKLVIVGRCSNEYKNEISKFKNVEVIGEVEDIREYVKSCTISIAPLQYGSGIKTKILETMAMGVPVVTNDIGAEGLNLRDGVEVMLANSEKEQAEKILYLLNNFQKRDELIKNGQNYIAKNHQWGNILSKFENIL